jgi:hypothetical protein
LESDLTGASKRPAEETSPDEGILSIEVGGKPVGAHLEAAIAAGRVISRPDGKFELRQRTNNTYIGNHREFGPCCEFLNDFMFSQIYGEKAVPIGCRDCYKVKVTPETLRQLVAVNDIAQDFSCSSKSGSEVDKANTSSLYASYFYSLGLDKARAIYKRLRETIDSHPKLGSKVKMFIKRGCTNYEHACGPSDRYFFDPRLVEIESYFWARFVRKKKPEKKYRDAMTFMHLIRTAYRIGDETYKDFTDGKELFPPTVTYDPNEPCPVADEAPAADFDGGAARHSISR